MTVRLLAFLLCLTAASLARAEYYTYRVLDRSGRSYSAKEMEFTPDSQKLVFSSNKGTMVLSVDGGRLLYEKPIKAFTVAFTRDNTQALLASTSTTQALNLQTGAIANVRWRLDPGYLGFRLDEEVGKLLINNVVKEGPIDSAGVPEGSELVAVHEFGRTNSVLGRGIKKTSGLLQGPAGTRIGLTVIPRGKRNPKRFDLIRRRGDASGSEVRFLSERPHRAGAPCTIFGNDEYVVLLDAASGEVNSVLAMQDSEFSGQRALSHDGKWLCSLGRRREKGETQFLIETFDVATRERVFATPFNDSWKTIRFHPRTSDLLVGSHDSVYVLSLESKQIERQINLGWKPTLRADATESGPTGWWLKETRGRSPKPLLNSFDVNPDGLLAVAAPSGEVASWSTESGEKIRQFAEAGSRQAEIVRLSPDGKWIAYYVGGLLTLETVEPDPED